MCKPIFYNDDKNIKNMKKIAISAKSIIPIHTQHDEYHKQWHDNVKSVNQHDLVSI